MSFGNKRTPRGGSPIRAAMAAAPAKAEANDVNPLAIVGVGGLVVALMLVAVVMLLTPVTYPATPVYYSKNALAYAAMANQGIPGVNANAQQAIGIDFSAILTPGEKEATEAMRQVAETCLQGKPRSFVAPRQAYPAFVQATEYLLCAMRTEPKRLCSSAERQRLVGQLLAYRDRRQNLLGIERVVDEMTSSRIAQQALELQRMAEGTTAPIDRPRVGNEIDPRIGHGVAELNRAGLLTAQDFGFLGLLLPAEYAPHLASGEAGRAACG